MVYDTVSRIQILLRFSGDLPRLACSASIQGTHVFFLFLGPSHYEHRSGVGVDACAAT